MLISKKKIIKSKGSIILKYLNLNKNTKIREIYFSEIKKGFVKGWNLHKKTDCNISVVFGKVKFTIFKKNKKLKTIIISRKNFSNLKIPKNHWFKYESLNNPYSIIVNYISLKHSNNEMIKRDALKFMTPE